MTDISKGDRVSYQVTYNDGQGFGRAHAVYRTEYGKVTSAWPAGAPVMARIAVEGPKPGSARYVTRKLRDVELAPTEPNPVSGTIMADALAVVDHEQNRHGGNMPTVAEVAALRDLAEAVRAVGVGHPELYRPGAASEDTDPVCTALAMARALAKSVASLSTYELASLVTVLKPAIVAIEIELGNNRPREESDRELARARANYAPRKRPGLTAADIQADLRESHPTREDLLH